MIARILSAGPTLGATLRPLHRLMLSSTIITVNRARFLAPHASMQASGDATTWRALKASGVRLPTTGIAFRPDIEKIRSEELVPPETVLMPPSDQPGGLWDGLPFTPDWSICLAMDLAWQTGHKYLHIYGTERDTGQTLDCTGHPGEDRSEDRWQRELIVRRAVTARLRDRGVYVSFHDEPGE